MKYAFKTLQLEAPGFYDLIGTWAETRLRVTDTDATIAGYGFTRDIAAAFTTLVLDWEARIILSAAAGLSPGEYELIHREDGIVYACRGQQSYPLPDGAVRVEVWCEPEAA
jgi:hypothetical protein